MYSINRNASEGLVRAGALLSRNELQEVFYLYKSFGRAF